MPDNVREGPRACRGGIARRKVPQKIYRPAVVVSLGEAIKEASQARVYSVAQNATLRAARSDPSLRRKRLLRMTMASTITDNDGGVRVKRCGKSAPPRQ